MSRIRKLFSKQPETAKLIAYLGALDPDFDTSLEICRTVIKAGVDLLELGVPFSDPLADGKTNQLAAERALATGATPDKVLQLVEQIRQHDDQTPIVLYTYYNLVFSKGLEAYALDAKKAGVDGILVLDLPPEEASEFVGICEKHSLDKIFLIAPTTPENRIPIITENASGFIYYVSREGVTGERDDLATDLEERVALIRKHTDLPIGVGFGISNAKQVESVAEVADAVIVGSSIVKIVSQDHENRAALLDSMEAKIKELRSGISPLPNVPAS